MASSPPARSSPSASEPPEHRDWTSLPRDLTASILSRLGTGGMVLSARVCRAWRSVCTDPWMWRSIDLLNSADYDETGNCLADLCYHAVNFSQGGLEDVTLNDVATDSLLMHIANRSSKLRRLRLVFSYRVTNKGLIEAVAKLPLLEHLDISHCWFSDEALEAVGRSCPLLKSLKLNSHGSMWLGFECNEDAFAIAQNMPGLRHLQLIDNSVNDSGVHAILDGCPHLEHLDLRECFNVKMAGNLKRRCSERIKGLRQPTDPLDDYEFNFLPDPDESQLCGDFDFSEIDDCRFFGFSGSSDRTDDVFDMFLAQLSA